MIINLTTQLDVHKSFIVNRNKNAERTQIFGILCGEISTSTTKEKNEPLERRARNASKKERLR